MSQFFSEVTSLLEMVQYKGYTFINTTPHPVRIVKDGEVILEIPPSPQPLRLVEKAVLVGFLEDIPVYEKQLDPSSMPDFPSLPNTFYIVSSIVLQYVKRSDFLAPHDLVRDAEGNVVGARGLARIL